MSSTHRTSSTGGHTYRDELLLALRLRDVPGPRIAEALAEVDSHVAETGEDPRAAFGAAEDYARELAPVLGGGASPWTLLRTGWTWSHALIAVLSLSGCWLLADGLHAAAAGVRGSAGTSAGVELALGVALLGALGVVLRRGLREEADPVVDPRTGEDMVPAVPRWALAVLVGLPVGTLALTVVIGLLVR